jgi:hypothetical protein
MGLIGRLHRATAEMVADQEEAGDRTGAAGKRDVYEHGGSPRPARLSHYHGQARRLARTMRSMGWVGIKSRRLAPGGWRTTECRGWSRRFREPQVGKARGPVERYQGERVER